MTIENAIKGMVQAASTVSDFSGKYVLLFDSSGNVQGKIRAEDLSYYGAAILGDLNT